LKRKLRGKPSAKQVLLSEEQSSLLPIPKQTFNAHRLAQANANSLSLVRFDRNSYSVPTKFAYRQITIVATIDEVRLSFEDQLIARHKRHWGREQSFFDPVHYLGLLERKPGGLDHAKPLENWDLPVCFGILRRRMESELAEIGTREFIKVLRLLERSSITELKLAVQYGLDIGVVNADAIRLILDFQLEVPSTLFCLDGRPHLKLVQVAQTDRHCRVITV